MRFSTMRDSRPLLFSRRSQVALLSLCGLLLVALVAPVTVQAQDEAAAAVEDLATLQPIILGEIESIEVYPPLVHLDGSRRHVQVLVTGNYADGRHQDLTRAVEFVSADPQVAAILGSVVYPVADGKTSLKILVAGHQAEIPVEVSNQASPDPVSFEFGALVALSKQGCNSGACHGSPSGKGGFRLSLRAYDPAVDRETLIREAFNRRTNSQEPESSLLLRKPLMELAHGGGRRMRTTDPAYRLLRDWIAEGMQLDAPDAPRCEKVEVYPPSRVLNWPAHTQQLSVLAHFTDGSVRDVTDIAVYTSSDEAVAEVDEAGFITGLNRGESAILVRYLDKMETSFVTILQDVEGFAWSDPQPANYVDDLVFSKLRKMEILPSDVCSDEQYVRRVYLDMLGVLPTVEETQSFLVDQNADKRAKLVDQLFEREEYAEFWALRWGDLFRLNKKKLTEAGVHKFYHWLVASVRDNKPYDQFASELLTASGSTFDNPAANYYRSAGDTNDCAETTSQLFLGIRIQCAKCHNHPFERWTQDNYYGIAAFFNRVQRKSSNVGDEVVVWMARGGEVTQPRTGQTMAPWLPLRGEAEVAADVDRRDALVAWLTEKDNPFFAQAEVNRIWGHLIGRGIVEPVDDFRASNPPSNAELLDTLAKDFREHGFDREHIIRTILTSRTYQLSSRKNDFNQNDEKYFSHARTRMLSAEQLLDAICVVTDVEEKYPGLPSGTRAISLPSPDVDHYFLKVFGQPAREMACECERADESNLSQALQMINGPLVHGKLTAENNRIRRLVTAGKNDQEIIEELYLAAVSRPPNAAEIEAATSHIGAQENRLQGLEDVCWALLNSKEFLFQH
jgi:hypothetical protein